MTLLGSLCYSNDVVIYSLTCNKWHLGTIPSWYPRYGSTTKLMGDTVISVGGFNGALLDDYVTIKGTSHTHIVMDYFWYYLIYFKITWHSMLPCEVFVWARPL